MGFGNELAAFAEGLSSGLDTGGKWQDRRQKRKDTRDPTDADLAGMPGFGGTGQGVPGVGTSGGYTGSVPKGDIAWKGATPEERALLLTIASKESPGYDVIYGGSKFSDYSQHPGRDIPIASGPNKGKTSSAAGKYQFLGSTWRDTAGKWGLKDFSPENQDIGALRLAEENYARITGRSLQQDLKSKDPKIIGGIGRALRGTWTSLPGGIEQGQGENEFVNQFTQFLGQGQQNFADGGAIPSPGTTRFATAGTVPAMAPGSVTSPAPNPADPYTPTRGYTQAIPVTTGGAGQPRRVTMPTGNHDLALVGGLTPSQVAWKKAQEANAVKPVAPAAPKPVAAQPAVNRKQLYNRYEDYRRTLTPTQSSRDHWTGGHRGSGVAEGLTFGDWKRSRGYADGGVVSMAKGGAIPSGADLSFEEILKQEKGDRDKAALRYNAAHGKAGSTAYGGSKPGKRAKAHDPDGYFTTPKKAPRPESRPDKETKTSSTGGDPNTSYPYGGDTATQEYSELAPEALEGTPPELIAVPPGAIPDMPQRLNGLPFELGGDGNSVAGTDADSPDRPKRPWLDRKIAEAAEFKPDPPGLAETPLQPYDSDKDPGAALVKRIVGGVTEALTNPNNTGTTTNPMGDDGAAYQGEPDPPAPPAQGAWLNGQWVPANTSAVPGRGFARGGAIPGPEDDGGPMLYADAGQGRQAVFGSDDDEEEDIPEGRPERSHANVAATPKLLEHVRTALQGGQEYISRAFNLKGQDQDAAIPNPQSQQAEQEGHARFASGEGAATSQEIEAIDNAIDPDRTLSEGDRQMVRLAKTTQWYLQQGRKEEAASSAAALMQYGATRFGQLSQLAATAYRHYQETGDPKDLQNTTRFMEQAYNMIPDGANVDIQVDPQQGLMRVTKTNPEGEPEMIEITPEQLPALLKSGMDNSMYWKSMLSLADPAAARQADSQKFQRETKLDEREYTEGREEFEHTRTREEKLEDEKRLAAAKTEEEKRALAAKLEEEKRAEEAAKRKALFDAGLAAVKPPKPGAGEVDPAVVGPVLGAVQAAGQALEANPNDEAAKAAYDEAASRYYDAVKGDAKQMEAAGLTPGTFVYKVAKANVQLPEGIQQAPDGKYYKLGANGKYIEVAPPAGS